MRNMLNRKTKNCKNLIFKFQATCKKFLSVVLHNCHENATFTEFVWQSVGSDALPFGAEVQSSNISTAVLSFLNLVPAHKNREEKG